ncbi:hypothetical protein BFW38_06505 [Terasakiispira papahanaumokuakeensis]|uniref:Reverse transcriptase domain-containing protein n=1 Tax=Terasakiispira papahanaumokuakeensis TaxID=197479 RepID=A0A1E2V8T7_9GAMM|nr:reverse transcriptase/maturase family protein [Terasakiispira papahanaumokuakeensis]ODC03246.1 hypothetical protein BFW38_06505 [Terasakiispira papahanaumokuakeensis]
MAEGGAFSLESVVKRAGELWERVVDFDNLLKAWESARKGKRYRYEALMFANRYEERLVELQNRLIWGEWQPKGFTSFPVYKPKYRLIEAPYFSDRIVHHALHRVVEPVLDKRFVYDSFACRKGKGIHAASLRVQHHLRSSERLGCPGWVLQADIRGYFNHIRHPELKTLISRRIKDARILDLWWKIIDSGGAYGVGQPIGALTSQLSANIYLDALDHYCKDDLGIKRYARYMDDWLIIGESKETLERLKSHLEKWLLVELGLELSKWSIYPASRGIDWAGYRIWSTHIRPRKRNIKNARQRIKAQARRGDELSVKTSLASFEGYTRNCSAHKTTQAIRTEASKILNPLADSETI